MEKSKISSVEKTRFMIYVIERYKEYIFDQRDSSKKWVNYKNEINHCINAMQNIFDYQKTHCALSGDNHEINKISSMHLVSYIDLEKAKKI